MPGSSKRSGDGWSLHRLRNRSNTTPEAGQSQEHHVVHTAALTSGGEHQSISVHRLLPRDPD